jgi:hypothetical protein
MNLTYRRNEDGILDKLVPGECTIRPTSAGAGHCWHLVMMVSRASTGEPWRLRAPVNPNAGPSEDGPCGRSWGLMRAGSGEWQISPSIDFGPDWHQTPTITGVPDGEPWQ